MEAVRRLEKHVKKSLLTQLGICRLLSVISVSETIGHLFPPRANRDRIRNHDWAKRYRRKFEARQAE